MRLELPAKHDQVRVTGEVREDGKVLYPVDDGIPVMLVEQSIPL